MEDKDVTELPAKSAPGPPLCCLERTQEKKLHSITFLVKFLINGTDIQIRSSLQEDHKHHSQGTLLGQT